MIPYIVIAISVVLVLLLCFCLAVASFSFDIFDEKYKTLDKKRNSSGISTLDFVDDINKNHFGSQISVTKCPQYRDHYSTGFIALSEQTMISNSLASLAIVSHELGHARQDASGDKLKKHWNLRKTGHTLGFFFTPFVLVGIVLSLLNVFQVLPQIWALVVGLSCVGIGILIFLFALVLKYREIQIEKEASAFALEFLKGYLTEPEIKECQAFLNSARLTYWGSLFRTMFAWTLLTKKEKMFR